jgi:hypothetical protein
MENVRAYTETNEFWSMVGILIGVLLWIAARFWLDVDLFTGAMVI